MEAALQELRAARAANDHAPPPPGAAAAAAAALLTGTGFWGADRTAVRELAALCGCRYSGDLMRGHTTHLVLAPAAAVAAAAGSRSSKLAKAAEWGIPCVHLAWLLDSAAAGTLQPPSRYAADPLSGAAAAQQQQQQQAPPLRCRPSSVASNALPLAAAAAASPAAQQAACDTGGAGAGGSGRRWQQERRRSALSPLHPNQLADQLRRLSVDPQPAQRQQQQQQVPLPPRQEQEEQRPMSADSPQTSLSLRGMSGGGPDAGWSAAEAASGRPGQREWSPMAQSPADAMLQSPAEAMHASMEAAQPDGGGYAAGNQAAEPPFAFSLAAALGRSTSDECGACGSPMLESPAVAAAAPTAGAGAHRAAAAAARSASPLASGGSQEEAGDPLCTLPTPACIRTWSDDGSSLAGSPAAQQADNGGGITQTPPAVRQAMAAIAGPTQHVPPRQEQQAGQQQQQLQAAAEQQQAPGALRDWSDDETVATEPPPGCELIPSSDSEAEGPPPLQQWQQQAEQPAQQQPAQQHAPLLPPPPLPEPGSQRKRGLLSVSRAGQPPAAGSSRWAAAAVPAATPPLSALAAAPAIKQEPVSPPAPLDDEPMPSPGVGPWEPEQPAGSAGSSPARHAHAAGSGDASPQLAPAGRRAEEQEPFGAPLAPVDEHFVTSRRPAAAPAGGRPPLPLVSRQHAPRTVRDWSDDSSSGSEQPSPPAGQRWRAGLTGLTQLDPASIVIARPQPSSSLRTGGGGVGLKLLQRPPRGNCVRAQHGLANLKGVQFAEQVQVAAAGAAGLTLSTKDKKTAVRLRPGGRTEEEAEQDAFRSADSSRPQSGGGGGAAATGRQQQGEHGEQLEEPVLAEPQTFYRLPDGTWWLELCRFYTAAQAEAAAAAAGAALVLPPGFDRSCELLKAVVREHAPLGDVAGGLQIRRAKQGSSALRLRGGTAAAAGGRSSYWWRSALDTSCWRLVTDRAAADYVQIE